ncbi:MAG: hypothetical protein KF851_19055 [Pirellulaceae bacterium]|jgi:hypothetical protein|nr:hypothetical protein [Pirellulaceae bacterium]
MNKTAIDLGRIDLETNAILSPLRVDLESFLKFSFEVSEGLDDLVAEIRQSGCSIQKRLLNRIAAKE